jgi:MFS family permease
VNNFSTKSNKRKILFLILLFISFLYLLLWYNESFQSILIITFGISFGLALMRPIISAYISDCTNTKEEGTISWVAEFIGKVWEVIGILLFGSLSLVFGVQWSFVFIGILILIISIRWLIQRYKDSVNKKTPWWKQGITLVNIQEPLPMSPTTQI